MASEYSLSPNHLGHEIMDESRFSSPSTHHSSHSQHIFLSPDTVSPLLLHVDTQSPAPSTLRLDTSDASLSTPGHYQASNLHDLDMNDDLLFDTHFTTPDSGLSSLSVSTGLSDHSALAAEIEAVGEQARDDVYAVSYPSSPDPSSFFKTSAIAANHALHQRTLVPPFNLQTTNFPWIATSQPTSAGIQGDCIGQDGPLPSSATKPVSSPTVTVSDWDRFNGFEPALTSQSPIDDASTVRGIQSGHKILSSSLPGITDTVRRDSLGRWRPDATTGCFGLDPRNRSTDEVTCIKDMAAQRDIKQRNKEVAHWLRQDTNDDTFPIEKNDRNIQTINHLRQGNDDEGDYEDDDDNDDDDDDDDSDDDSDDDGIPLGNYTENKHLESQIYIDPVGGPLNKQDYQILHAANHWESAPISHAIITDRFQPESSQAAIQRFQKLLSDNDSMVSRSATWGTRRHSFPSVQDTEGGIRGNILKKLSISKTTAKKENKSGGILQELCGLVRRKSTSSIRKRPRSRSKNEKGNDLCREISQQSDERQANSPHLSPISGTSSWAKQPVHSINSAVGNIAQELASFGSPHARSCSVGGMSPVHSPRKGLSLAVDLAVDKMWRRPRSKSDLTKRAQLGVLKKSPQASLVDVSQNSSNSAAACKLSPAFVAGESIDDDVNDDDALAPDSELKRNSANEIDNATIDFSGFRQHVLKLNPSLACDGHYLADRIAHQQVIRYNHLLNLKLLHTRQGISCSSGPLCIARGGSAKLLDQNDDARLQGNDETRIEGVLGSESFPTNIPHPPTQYLPAEVECQICFQTKKILKPSDWTKHVHEDVGPFTCTWENCKDPKSFKRKADWVRHENEGHRHLEWWSCDVGSCDHSCYRKDNFLLHLVREHKFVEPKMKTRMAMKQTGSVEPTWRRVEECHRETRKRPQDEPCRFCGRILPTWKKLTVHLAKHMEQIALPILRLVDARAKELTVDCGVGPVADVPAHSALTVEGLHGGQLEPAQNMTGLEFPMEPSQLSLYAMQFGGMEETLRQGLMDDVKTELDTSLDNEVDLHGGDGFNDANINMTNNRDGTSGTIGMNDVNYGDNSQGNLYGLDANTEKFGQTDLESYMNYDSTGLEPFPQLEE